MARVFNVESLGDVPSFGLLLQDVAGMSGEEEVRVSRPNASLSLARGFVITPFIAPTYSQSLPIAATIPSKMDGSDVMHQEEGVPVYTTDNHIIIYTRGENSIT